ncbi:ribosomal RNA small subunit methyltransferase E [mine drainage metagenome]|uniref:16S rRNA (uracil(1498)-N(3))-methyltransferase n=1 Tax=mine drainage metagenome TaxID=410659 RepID=A0A1J5QI49_9ZZZZ
MLPLFLADTVAGPKVVLEGEEARHAASVERLRVGERIRVSDGVGEYVDGVVTAVAKFRVAISVESRALLPPNDLKVVVAQALAKGDSSTVAVELLTEVGVDEILPWSALRSIAKWDDEKKNKGVARWMSVAREASKQSRRIAIPKIDQLNSTKELIARIVAADCAIVLHESGQEPIGKITIPSKGEVLLVVGPEGGIDESELELFKASGAHIAVLGPTVLRSAHAGCVAAALIVSRRWG